MYIYVYTYIFTYVCNCFCVYEDNYDLKLLLKKYPVVGIM